MPRLQVPVEITKVISVDPTAEREPGDKGVTVLVEIHDGAMMVVKMTPDVAHALYEAVCEE